MLRPISCNCVTTNVFPALNYAHRGHIARSCTHDCHGIVLRVIFLVFPPFVLHRPESVMFIEALAALDQDPSRFLVLPEGSQSRSLDSAHVGFQDAVRAMAVHIYGHASASLARCMRAALQYLQQRHWLQLKLSSRAAAVAAGAAGKAGNGSSSTSRSVVHMVDIDGTRDALKQVCAGSILVHACCF